VTKKAKSKADEVADEVLAAQTAETPTAREKRICHLFASWEASVKALAEERKRRGEDVAAAQAGLRAVIEEGVAAGDDVGRLRKLSAVEVAWQNLDERKAERVEALKIAKLLVEQSDKRLREAIENSNQLALFDSETGEVFG
jgi:hypothetical protein